MKRLGNLPGSTGVSGGAGDRTIGGNMAAGHFAYSGSNAVSHGNFCHCEGISLL
jgi:hypothetical protein